RDPFWRFSGRGRTFGGILGKPDDSLVHGVFLILKTPDYLRPIRRLPYRFRLRECVRMKSAIGSKMDASKAIKVNPMKSFFALLVTMLLGASAFGQQSLGEIARQNRNKKKPSSVVKLSDDNMSRTIAPDNQDAKAEESTANTDKDKEAAKDDKARKENPAEAEKDKKDQIQKNID